MKKWLEPPVFSGEEERNLQANIVNTINLYLFPILALSVLSVFLLTPTAERSLVLSVILGLLLLNGISRVLLFNGYVELSGGVIAVSTWTADIVVAVLSGGINSPMMFAAITVAIVFGLFIRRSIGTALIGMTILAGLVMAILPGYDSILPRLFHFSELGVWFILLLCMLFAGLAVRRTLNRLENALDQSRQKTEETVVKSEAMFRSMFDNISDGMIFSDRAGLVSFRSPTCQRIDGYSNAEWSRFQLFELVHPEDRDLVQRNWQAVLVNPAESVRLEYRIRHKGGAWVWVESVFQNLLDDPEIRSIVLTTRDITKRKQGEESLRQRDADVINSALEERQRLARELHDSVGQVLGYVSFQTEAARGLYASGKPEEADAQLARLASIAQDAHADVREYILNLRVAPSTRDPLFKTLQTYLDGFTRNYSIQTHLVIGAGLDENTFDANAQLNLFRVAQEALSNVRKHAGAREVVVTFDLEGERVRMTVQDDGHGFDLQDLLNDDVHHFGVSFMNERVNQLRGDIRFESALQSGTLVVVEIPIRKEKTP